MSQKLRKTDTKPNTCKHVGKYTYLGTISGTWLQKQIPGLRMRDQLWLEITLIKWYIFTIVLYGVEAWIMTGQQNLWKRFDLSSIQMFRQADNKIKIAILIANILGNGRRRRTRLTHDLFITYDDCYSKVLHTVRKSCSFAAFMKSYKLGNIWSCNLECWTNKVFIFVLIPVFHFHYSKQDADWMCDVKSSLNAFHVPAKILTRLISTKIISQSLIRILIRLMSFNLWWLSKKPINWTASK